MGQKVNPIGLRLGINRTWDSRWFADDGLCRPAARGSASCASICTERLAPGRRQPRSSSSGRPRSARITIHTARPGVVIGKKGADIEKLRSDLAEDDQRRSHPQHRRDPQARDRRQAGRREHRPAARAPRRLPPRHEARGAVGDAARRPGHPHQLRAAGSAAPRSRASSGIAKAACRCTRCAPISISARRRRKTTYGTCGVKVWVFKGEILAHDPMAQDKRAQEQQAGALTARPHGRTEEVEIMLQPKRTKYRKAHKGRIHGLAKGGTDAQFRRLRPEGDGAGPRHRAPDRGGAPRHHPPHEARSAASGSAIFPDVPVSTQAGRGAHGQRQGHARVLGRAG